MSAGAGPGVDLTGPLHVHVVGIGGAGMSAIATVLRAMGHTVSGSDLKDGPVLARLRASGVDVAVGHDAANVRGADLVAISTAVPRHNPEVVAAGAAGVPVLSRADVLVAICATRRTVAVAGTHGKTTTSSMLALALRAAGLAPSAIIGGDVNEIGSNALWDDGELLVVEADESDGTFLRLTPTLTVVTNVEPDHLDHYGSLEALEEAFVAHLRSAGQAVVCADDPAAARIGASVEAVSYGTAPDATYRIADLHTGRAGSTFTVRHGTEDVAAVALPVPGAHNARNATAALVAGVQLGAAPEDLARALGRFGGVARRFEPRGTAAGVTFVDDYTHLPTEVRAALAAARDGGWARVVCAFQPHRYSRTAAVAQDFATAFDDADVLVLTDIYPAGEAPLPGITGTLVLDAVLGHDAGRELRWAPRLDDVVEQLVDVLRPGDLCLTLGAGDLTAVPDVVIERLGSRP